MTIEIIREPLIEVEDLSVVFRSRTATVEAVKGLSFTIGRGETLAIVGESGSGKSVTALSIMGLVGREGGDVTGGRIRFHAGPREARDLVRADEPTMRRIRGNRIAMIFQEPMTSLNPVFTIGDQLAETIVLHQGLSRAAALDHAAAMLERVRIADARRRLSQYPHELSGGMRQRVMIAMALACRPALLVADEPTTALDVTIQAEILTLIRELQREIGMAVLFITHDLAVVAEIADRVVVMRHGEKVEEAEVGRLFAAPNHPYTMSLLAAVPRLGAAPRLPAPRAVEPVLVVRGLERRFPVRRGLLKRHVGDVHAVADVSFTLLPGETLGLVGESGCGKTTTGRALMRLITPTAGRVRIGGRDVEGLTGRALRSMRRDVQMIFQDPYASLNPRLTALASVTEPLAVLEPSMSRDERRAVAERLMRRVGLEPAHLDRYPHQFSGGQRQRLAIARALSLEPKVIVADEPVSALDVSVRAQVLELMRELQRDLGVAYLFISHDMAVIEQVAHRVAVMYRGEIVEIGPTAAVLGDPRHDYTRRLISSVPVADPTRRPHDRRPDATEMPSPVRPVGWTPPPTALIEVSPGRSVRRPLAVETSAAGPSATVPTGAARAEIAQPVLEDVP